MLTYEKISNWLKEKENKDKIILGACFILVFVVGFGTGNYERGIRRDAVKPQINYTTQTAKKPAAPGANTETGTVLGTQTKATAASSTPTGSCIVKGNISTGGRKIYHVQGGAFYKIVKPEQCFKTEAEALAAGFVKSGR